MLFICHPRCTTCAKTRNFLDENRIAYTWRDIAADNPTRAELEAWQARSGLPLKRFFNTSGMAYRTQGLAAKLPGMAPDAQLALLATDGMLVKRPLLVAPEFVLVGFKKDEWAEKLL